MTASIESSQIDIGDGYQFTFIKQLVPDITFDGSTVNSPAQLLLYKLEMVQVVLIVILLWDKHKNCYNSSRAVY